MYPSFNDFDPDYFEDYDSDEQPETEVIAGVEIRGSQPEEDWNPEEMPF